MAWKDELKRGDVVRARLDPVEGSEQAGERPVLILSPDFLNARSPTVIVASITSKHTERIFRNEVLVAPPEGGLTLLSKVLLSQVRTLDKRRFVRRLGEVSETKMAAVDEAIRVSMGLVEF